MKQPNSNKIYNNGLNIYKDGQSLLEFNKTREAQYAFSQSLELFVKAYLVGSDKQKVIARYSNKIEDTMLFIFRYGATRKYPETKEEAKAFSLHTIDGADYILENLKKDYSIHDDRDSYKTFGNIKHKLIEGINKGITRLERLLDYSDECNKEFRLTNYESKRIYDIGSEILDSAPEYKNALTSVMFLFNYLIVERSDSKIKEQAKQSIEKIQNSLNSKENDKIVTIEKPTENSEGLDSVDSFWD